MTNNQPKNWLTGSYVVCFLAMICCLLWGSAFPCIKIGCQLFSISADSMGSQILFAGYRFFLAGILAVFIGSIINRKLLFPKRGPGAWLFVLDLYRQSFNICCFTLDLPTPQA